MKKYIKWFEMIQKAILIGPEGLEEIANHEKTIRSLAAVTGNTPQAKEIGKLYKTEQIQEIIDYVVIGISVESAKELVNTSDSI